MRIYLLGFMGVGKSHWGSIWAQHFQLNWIDLDQLIIQKTSSSIEDIFKEQGEMGFRKIEAACLRETNKMENALISVGGGTPCFEENMHWMNEHGTTIWLEASPQYLANRLAADTEKNRPLIAVLEETTLEKEIERLLIARIPFYQKAQHRLNAEQLDKNSIYKHLNQNKPNHE
jgi:shikimate kinase